MTTRPRVEWVIDDGVCGFAGCQLPRCHTGSCEPVTLEGKRKRVCTSKNLETSTEYTIEDGPRASRKSSDGSSQPVSERLHAARCPRVTVWYREPEGHVKAWHGVVVRVCRENGLLVRFVGGTEANKDFYWVSAKEDEWAWGHAYAAGKTIAPRGIARARPPARSVEQEMLPIL